MERLGVKRETLYAYTSRGLVRSVAGEKGRARRYLADDIEALRTKTAARAGHGPVAASALRWGEPVLETSISRIDAAGLAYRGHDVAHLARADTPFEAVAELLWTGAGPALDVAWPCEEPGLAPSKLLPLLPEGEPPLSAVMLALTALGLADATRFDRREVVELPRARALVRRLATWAALPHGIARVHAASEQPSVAAALAAGLGAKRLENAARAVNRALVVSAEHELPASTFAGRVAASAGADLYACLGAALAALSGPEHGGMCTRVEALLREVERPERARDVIAQRARRGEMVPGFGHRLYPAGDPRVAPLLEIAAEIGGDRPKFRVISEVLAGMRELGHEPPTIDLGLIAVAQALGLPDGSALAFFGLGRIAGVTAHIFEQRRAGFLLRPRARYVESTSASASTSRS